MCKQELKDLISEILDDEDISKLPMKILAKLVKEILEKTLDEEIDINRLYRPYKFRLKAKRIIE